MSEEREQIIEEQLRQIEIRSDEVQEIMGFIPHWIIRWGITVILLVVVFVLIGSYFFSYPDIITSTIMVTTENPPAPLVARSNGKIVELFVKDKQQVKEGDYIAVIENSSNHRHLLELKNRLEAKSSFFTYFEGLAPVEPFFERSYSLGELQSIYASFLKSLDDYRHFIDLGYHRKQIDSLNEQINRHNILYEQTKRQLALMEEELKLSREQYQRANQLYNDKIISKSDLNIARSNSLQKEFSHEGTRSSLSNSRIRILQLEQNVLDLQFQYRNETKRLQLALNQGYENLTGRIAQWEQMYLLKAPMSGVVTFTAYWSVNQNVKAGDRVVTVIPNEGGEIIGKVVLPIQGSGKVKVGQPVNIKFTNFPHMDFGIVHGVVTSKSLVASDNFYSLEVELPKGLVTSYGESLPFSQEMQGIAEIITQEARLLERVLKPIKAFLDKM
jgi:HlyD family secretion protein